MPGLDTVKVCATEVYQELLSVSEQVHVWPSKQ